MMLPNLQQTNDLYHYAVSQTRIINHQAGYPDDLSAKHYQNVAFVASTIAEYSHLDIEKSYILGLLHDYGEYIEKLFYIPFMALPDMMKC